MLDDYYWMRAASMPPALQAVGIGGNVKKHKAAAKLAMTLTAAARHLGGPDADVDGSLADSLRQVRGLVEQRQAVTNGDTQRVAAIHQETAAVRPDPFTVTAALRSSLTLATAPASRNVLC